MKHPRILIAGVGNIFLGDDAFGVEVVRRMAQRRLPAAVRVIDFGIKGIDLAYTLLEDYDGAILVDTVSPAVSPACCTSSNRTSTTWRTRAPGGRSWKRTVWTRWRFYA
jgi:hydrogenase maturation protease